jgi:hypothetical protein
MSKTKRERRRDKRLGRAHAAPASGGGGRGGGGGGRSRRVVMFLRVWPLVVVAAVVGLYFATKDTRVMAIVGTVGALVWLGVGLSTVGGAIPPRDRGRAGAIDFGSRR